MAEEDNNEAAEQGANEEAKAPKKGGKAASNWLRRSPPKGIKLWLPPCCGSSSPPKSRPKIQSSARPYGLPAEGARSPRNRAS